MRRNDSRICPHVIFNYVLSLFDHDAFEKWLAVSAFVKVVAYHCIPSGFSYPNSFGVRWRVIGFEVLDLRGFPIVGLVLG